MANGNGGRSPSWDPTPRGSSTGIPTSWDAVAIPGWDTGGRGTPGRRTSQAGPAGQAPTDPSVRVSGPQLTDPSRRVSGG